MTLERLRTPQAMLCSLAIPTTSPFFPANMLLLTPTLFYRHILAGGGSQRNGQILTLLVEEVIFPPRENFIDVFIARKKFNYPENTT